MWVKYGLDVGWVNRSGQIFPTLAMWLVGCHGSMGTCVKLGTGHRLAGGLVIAMDQH